MSCTHDANLTVSGILVIVFFWQFMDPWKSIRKRTRHVISTSNLFLCFVFICKRVEHPDSHRYLETNGRIPWINVLIAELPIVM